MDEERAERVFPNFFKNFQMPDGAKEIEIEVFRVCFYGKINREAFWGTYEAQLRGLVNVQNADEAPSDPGSYSTSCYEREKDAKKQWVFFTKKYYPKAIVAKGVTKKHCGPCQRTKERDKKVRTSHVDWWIYENSNPQDYFEEVTL